MNISVVSRQALKAVANETTANKLHICRKVVIDLEKNPEEVSTRVCGDLRKVLTSVKESPESFAEQVAQAGALLLRVRDIDPRRLKRIAEDEVEDEVTDETEIVAGTSASDVSKSLPLTIDGIHQVIRKFAGALPCDAPLD